MMKLIELAAKMPPEQMVRIKYFDSHGDVAEVVTKADMLSRPDSRTSWRTLQNMEFDGLYAVGDCVTVWGRP